MNSFRMSAHSSGDGEVTHRSGCKLVTVVCEAALENDIVSDLEGLKPGLHDHRRTWARHPRRARCVMELRRQYPGRSAVR